MILCSSILPHHCKHVPSAHSLSKSPPTGPIQSQYSFRPVCHIAICPSLHESNGSALNCPCYGPIGALWVKGYCWSRGEGGVSEGKESKDPNTD